MSEIIFGAILLSLSAFLFILTFSFPATTIALSPTVFPRFVTVCAFILSALLLSQGIRKRLRESGADKPLEFDRTFARRFLLLAACGFLYTRVIRYSGYLVATPLLIAASMLIFGERKWIRIVLVAGLTTAVLYTLFRMIFRVPLPRFDLF
jgi:putative tricarboxylic transport membrane protein